MRGNRLLRGVAAAAVALGGYMAADSGFPSNGVMSSAHAKEFFTRKRINGQWVTGVFPADSVSRTTPVHRRPRFVARHVRPATKKFRVEAARIAPSAVSVDPPSRPDAGVADIGAAPAPETADRGPAATPAPSEPIATTSASTADAAPERLTRLHAALVARAQELASSGGSVPSAFVSGTLPLPVAPTTAPGLGPTPPGATARPAEITAQTAAVGLDKIALRGDESVAKSLEPKAVSYDFETGVKTTTFANSVVREPFDVAAMKRIAAPTR